MGAGFYSSPQVAAISARSVQAPRVLTQLAATARGRTPQPLQAYNLPGIYNVPWSQWWAIAQRLTLDADAALQLALFAALEQADPNGAPALAADYFSHAQAIISAWSTVNKSVGDQDSPLSMTECAAAFVLADILMPAWPGRAAFDSWLQAVYIPTAVSIQSRANNWGAWGSFGTLVAKRHVGQDTTADIAALRSQLLTMIAPNGTLPQEMLRTGAQTWYTYYALVALTCACRVVRNGGGPDFYRDPSTGPRLVAAINNVISMAQHPTATTGAPANTAAQPWPWDLVAAMAEEFDNDQWRQVAAPWQPISYWQHHTGWNLPTLTALAGL